MKTYSIGRELGCDIVINDSTDVVSRRHAILNVTPTGSMTIIDQSSNGTYVNGIRINSNVPVPVTRKDIISFAHVAKLDWNMVPRSNAWVKYAVSAVVAVAIVAFLAFGLDYFKNTDVEPVTPQDRTALIDSVKKAEMAKQDSLRKIEKAKQDSIKKAEKAKQDSIRKAKKAEESKKKKAEESSKKKSKKNKEKEDSTKQRSKRVIG